MMHARKCGSFESERSPSAAIRRAALCERQDNKRHPHQWRIPKTLLEQAGGGLVTKCAVCFGPIRAAVSPFVPS